MCHPLVLFALRTPTAQSSCSASSANLNKQSVRSAAGGAVRCACVWHASSTPSASSKRSFKRAQRRAIRDGIARYKGKMHTPDSLALKYVGQAAPRRPPSQPCHQQGALRCVWWNAGGLHAGRYQELLGWLDSQTTDPIHTVCIQEAHWADWAEYSSSNWMCIHSGIGSSQAGILFLDT